MHFAKAVKDSLAGRLGHVRLRPLTLGEINGHAPTFLGAAFSRSLKGSYPDLDKRDIIRTAFCGGYPETLDLSEAERRTWFMEYLDDILEKDVQDVTVSHSDFAHLKWFAENLAHAPFTGIVLYSGTETLRFGEGFYAVPLSALGE